MHSFTIAFMSEIQTNRRLAAILAADVVGYSKLMADDETGTLTALTRHRETQFNPAVARHRGRIVKLMGDGTLVEFSSVVDAVNCAAEIQQSADSAITLRIGINLGDVIIQGDDIYGDGVNIAARLEPLAKPGGMCVSLIVNESVDGRTEVTFQNGGEVKVKNIDRPLKVWHWHPDNADFSANAPLIAPEPAAIQEQPSVAVLPFDNMSGDAEQEYFSDGISEDIITDLSKVSGLLVIARNSSFAYKGQSPDLRVVGRELGVGAVLEGSVRRAGNRVRVTAQLIDAKTGGHMWADRYDRDLTDIFAVQDELTLEIVTALKVQLTPEEKTNIMDSGTKNIEAHDYYLRGRNRLTSANTSRDVILQSMADIRRALELDPDFARAHGVLATLFAVMVLNRWTDEDGDTVLARAEQHARTGVKLAPNEAEIYASLGFVLRFRKNLELALEASKKALSISPNNAHALINFAEVTMFSGNPREALGGLERAMRLDPGFAHQTMQFLGIAHLLLGNMETAAMTFRQRISLSPDTDNARAMLASVLGHLGEIDEAKRLWQEVMQINPQFSMRQRMDMMVFEGHGDVSPIYEGLALAGLPTE
jgi:adenylate cyclase